MRKVTSGLFISLDGVTESPDQWQFGVFNDEMGAALGKHLNAVDTVMLGRVTYQEWEPYWTTATSDLEFAEHINRAPKYVVSNTLESVRWGQFGNATLVRGNDLAATVARLKQQPGKNIAVTGSPTLARTLLSAGLLDELQLMVHPVVVGRGKRLFDGWDDLRQLDLVDAWATKTGVAFLTYRQKQ
jgi:dihydrofolate reductase